MRYKKFPKEIKILLLESLQRGYFTEEDSSLLGEYLPDHAIDMSLLTEDQKNNLLEIGEVLLRARLENKQLQSNKQPSIK